MFLTLMRKDARILKPAILALVVLVVFCDAALPAFAVYQWSHRRGMPGMTASLVAREVQGGTMIATALGCALVAAFAGSGATVERRERWADLAAMLPVSRVRRTLARLAVAASLAVAAQGVQFAIASIADALVSGGWRARTDYGFYACVAAAMFGVAWLCAALLRSAAAATSIGIGVVLASILILQTIRDGYFESFNTPAGFDYVAKARFDRAYSVGLLVAGVATTLAGTFISSRRVEP